ncbi:hypothetical protein J4462_00125 [Candidatus Pacearchaeota archaeon]|nr:hypothetical protein [Candidatus Pacearchaeota archaeon]
MHKRGQFYLIAALVIIGILVGLTTVYNSTKTSREDLTVFDISSALQFEGLQVVTSGIFYDLTDEEILAQLQSLINASAQQNPNHDFLGIYGNETTLFIWAFTTPNTGSISVTIGSEPIIISETESTHGLIETIERPEEGIIVVEIDEEKYVFDLHPDQKLYLIIKKERGEETFIATPRSNNPKLGQENAF